MGGWLKIKSAAAYADVSPKTVRAWLKQGLKHSRVGGCVRIKRADLDQWFEEHAVEVNEVDQVVDEVMSELGL